MAYSLIAANSLSGSGTSSGAGATTAVNWGAIPTNGNLLCVAITFGGNATTSGPTGWTRAATVQNTVAEQQELWYKVASGETTAGPVFTIATAVGYVIEQCEVTGFTGTPTLDTTGTNFASGVSTLAVTAGATTAAGDFVFAGCGDAEGATAGITWSPSSSTPTGVVDISTVNPPKNSQGERDAWNTAGGSGTSPSITFNLSASSHTALAATIATFKSAAAPSPFKNPALAMVQTGVGGRHARNRAGYWHTIADQINSFSAIVVAETMQRNIAQPLVQAGLGGRAVRRRDARYIQPAGGSQTLFQDSVISTTEDHSNRYTVSKFKNWDAPLGNFLANLFVVASIPIKNFALYMVAFSQGGRRARGRVGFWHTIADKINTTLQSSSEIPQINIADTKVQAGLGGRAARRRDARYIQASNQTQTTFQDQIIPIAKDRSGRQNVSKFRNWDAPPGNFLANLIVAVVVNPIKNIAEVLIQTGLRRPRRRIPAWYAPVSWNKGLIPSAAVSTIPFKNFALAMVQIGQGGKRARSRIGFWHTIADKVNTTLSSGVEQIQINIAQNMVQAGIGGRASRRRDRGYISTANQTQTTFQDAVITQAKDRSSRAMVPRFRNNDIPGTFFALIVQYIYPPFKKSAEFMVALGVGGRRAKARVGFWHTIADKVNTMFTSLGEVPQINIADTKIQAGLGGRASRRRDSRYIQASSQTQTTYQDQVISESKDTTTRRNVSKFLNRDFSSSILLNITWQPFRMLARVSVLIGVGGRRAIRRVGFWHTTADQVNTLSAITGAETPQINISQSMVQSGKGGRASRRRDPRFILTNSETQTTFQDQMISKPAERTMIQRVKPNPKSWVRDWSWATTYFPQYAVAVFLNFISFCRDGTKTMLSRSGALIATTRDSTKDVLSRSGQLISDIRDATFKNKTRG